MIICCRHARTLEAHKLLTPSSPPATSAFAGGKLLLFVISARNQSVQCSISRDALERHFWLPAGANDARTLKAFADGRLRITAAAERRTLKSAGAPIALSAADFASR
ncbi:DUF1488 family protein [Paraburkholderia hospita]|uniref:DUF1488 family protein n=1 Tax=Paraburkholderia hospita TaxID=169430 RepID=UPI0009D1D229|nr:Protein of unknown function [Paraburkholderia hospita]